MLCSMTGFGKGEAAFGNGGMLSVQLSAVNRKQLELRCSLPNELAALEIEARKRVAQVVSRGALQLRCAITSMPVQLGTCRVNTALLDELIRQSRAARVRANLTPDVNVEQLMSFYGVVSSTAPESDGEELTAAFQKALDLALTDFNRMRHQEGEALKFDLLARIGKLEQLHGELSRMSEGYPDAAKKKLLSRLEAEKLPVSADDPALLKELLFYVDKGDVTEELTRLSSHFKQFRNFLDSDAAAGRNLDFLAQEIFREITTFGNKSPLPETAPLVVTFKSEMEKIREQIQNIE